MALMTATQATPTKKNSDAKKNFSSVTEQLSSWHKNIFFLAFGKKSCCQKKNGIRKKMR